MRSPGVYTTYSTVKTAQRPQTTIRACFVGVFQRGPLEQPLPITSVDELIKHFGLPTEFNYNDWFQVMNFLEYHKGIYVLRSMSPLHSLVENVAVPADIKAPPESDIRSFRLTDDNPFGFTASQKRIIKNTFNQFDRFTFEGEDALNGTVYTLMDVENFDFVPRLNFDIKSGAKIMKIEGAMTASVEMPNLQQFNNTETTKPNGVPSLQLLINGEEDFALNYHNYPVNNKASVLSIWARSPGLWGDAIQVGIVTKDDFTANYPSSTSSKYIFDGVTVERAFRQVPKDGEYGVAVMFRDSVVETYTGKWEQIQAEINSRSAYIFIRRHFGEIYSTAMTNDNIKRPLQLLGGVDGSTTPHDLDLGYQIFLDKETYRVDCIIGNERDNGLSAIRLADARQDAIAFVGAPAHIFHNPRDTAKIVDNLIEWRETNFHKLNAPFSNTAPFTNLGNAPTLESSFVVLVANYGQQFDPYNNRVRMVNLAGDIAGLRALSNERYGCFTAAAGVNRGVLVDNKLLVVNLTQAHRDVLYTHNLNPVISLNNVGNVFWGNRTLAPVEDHFSSIHIRSLCNTIIRSASDLLRTFVMDNIDQYTIQSVIGSLKPFLTKMRGAGGLEDFKTRAFVEKQNELNVEIFVKPTGVAEFITIRLVNTGSETIAYALEQESLRRTY